MVVRCGMQACCAVVTPTESTALPGEVHRIFTRFTVKMQSETNAWVTFSTAGVNPRYIGSCLHRMLAFSEVAVLDLA